MDRDSTYPIWLVRHAPTSWTGRRWCGRADPPLTAAGRRLAGELAVAMATEIPRGSLVLTSPARRAAATATELARPAALETTVLPELIEVDVGRVEGLDWGELSTREPGTAAAILAGSPVDWPGGETASAVHERAGRAARRIRRASGVRPVVVVSHGAFLAVLADALGVAGPLRDIEPCGVIRVGP